MIYFKIIKFYLLAPIKPGFIAMIKHSRNNKVPVKCDSFLKADVLTAAAETAAAAAAETASQP